MGDRITMDKKSKPFTTFMFYIPKRISVCGDQKFEKIWKDLVIEREGSEKMDVSAFVWKNIKKDLGGEDSDDLLNGYEYKRRIKEEYELLQKIILDKLAEKGFNFPTFQEYVRFIIERESDKRSKRDAKTEQD